MNQILEFTNRAQVKVKEYTQTAEVKIYVDKTPFLEITQKLGKGCCCKETIFCITIKNNSNQDIENLELIDWVCSDRPFTLGCIELQEGCYNLCPDYIYFYIPLLKQKEQLSITLSLCSTPRNCMTNYIEATHYTLTSS